MRLFVALDIPQDIRRKIATLMDGLRNFAPDARWVSAESLHVTLKFIGEFPENRLDDAKKALASVGGQPFDISFRSAGFFTSRSPRVFWIGIEAGYELKALASSVETVLVPVGIAREERDFTPHLTLARMGSGRPQGSPRDRDKPKMYELKSRVERMSPPDFGTMTAGEFFLYLSKLSPHGAQYTKLERFALR